MPINPLYASWKANAPIVLGNAPVEVTARGTTIRGQGQASLRLVPRDSVIVQTVLPGNAAPRLFLTDDDVMLRYGTKSNPVPVIAINSRRSNNGLHADYRPSSGGLVLCADRRARLQRAVFHVLNFPDFFSTGVNSQDLHYESNGSRRSLGRAVLSQFDWTIEIEALPGTADLIRQLRAEGGHAITHVGSLKRRDGRTFTVAAAECAIHDLHRFLSFARGQWSGIFGVCGFNARDALVYQGWQERLSSPWGSTFRWFDRHHGETLAQAYDGFAGLLHDRDLGSAANTALY